MLGYYSGGGQFIRGLGVRGDLELPDDSGQVLSYV